MSRPKSIDRERVLDAAGAIVSSQGAAALTIDAVAKAVGITKGGVQSCFGTKENLIAAMLRRWGDAYDESCRQVAGADADGLSEVRAYIEVTATSGALNAKAASLLAALLQSQSHLEWIRNWYRRHLDATDASTDEGRRTRLAFLATEGAFMLRYFGLVDMSEAEWSDIFKDIERCSAPQLQGEVQP